MPCSEDNYFPFAGKCGFCRVNGGEVHSPNCLINLPAFESFDSHKKLSPHWHAGFEQKPSTAVTAEEQEAYRMGATLKQALVDELEKKAATAPARHIDRAIQSVSSPTSIF